ncbi:haloalkane dehalogenase [Prolixibacteraceae bacterium Z1-6]|uniref:Haloalkane dehalogenase n=1 Tax=Draconibacterium aestuarii TaxID=2998507 RepID=A0A9X3J3Y3_9BACT|nr:haloalkane dehalogenase [Prolixibacteraceae bacterium Z1-6]
MTGQDRNTEIENSLPDYPFHANYIEIDHLKIHFIDEGDKTAPAILFLHGVPTWSFTFRRIFHVCLNAGCRVIAPDLPGFGRSDKPDDHSFYTITRLVEIVDQFVQQKMLQSSFLFAQDWGAILGMILAAKHPEFFSGIIACNGYLPDLKAKSPLSFVGWKLLCKYSPVLPVGRIVDIASEHKLSPAERKAYDLPFKNKKDKIAIHILPQLIPVKDNSAECELIRESWAKLKTYKKPFLTVFSSDDKITRGGEKLLQQRIPGAKNQEHKILKGRHFLQEDAPTELGLIVTEFVRNNR